MNADEVLTTSEEDQIPIWEEYYKQHVHLNVTCPDTLEIASAIDSLKANKHPKPDNIQSKLLKAFGLIKFYHLNSQRI